MNSGWLRVIGAAVSELLWVTGLKYAALPWEWAATLAALCGSTYCLITAGNTLPVGTAYSVFVGLSSVGTVAVEYFVFGVTPSAIQLILIAVLMAGVIGLKLLNEKRLTQEG